MTDKTFDNTLNLLNLLKQITNRAQQYLDGAITAEEYTQTTVQLLFNEAQNKAEEK